METPKDLSHVDEQGRIQMVDVGHKMPTPRQAVATGRVNLPREASDRLAAMDYRTAKGSIIETAILAGIMAAKKTADLIPLCHPLPIEHIAIDITPTEQAFHIRAEVKTTHTTGVEMEALTAVSAAALTIYDMCKAISHAIEISHIQLESKTGGKHNFQRPQ